MTIEEKQEEIIEEFAMFDDWMAKYEYIIDLGKELDPMSPVNKSPKNLVKGCQAQLWIHPENKGGLLYFEADSDAIISKGLIALILRVYSGQTPEDILAVKPFFIERIGLSSHLSPNRSNGLSSMIKKLKTYALAISQNAI